VVDLDPNEGSVRLNDHERNVLRADRWRKLVAMVPSESGWWDDRVSDHFDPDCDAGPLLRAVGLPGAMDWDVSRLSSGERHRLAIARALCNRPKAILLDEPTATLDQAATELIEDLVRAECDRGVSIIIVTHDQAQASRLCTRHFAMVRGHLQPEPSVTG
jgi:ABC-type lipoprotein export system ATPase subunit